MQGAEVKKEDVGDLGLIFCGPINNEVLYFAFIRYAKLRVHTTTTTYILSMVLSCWTSTSTAFHTTFHVHHETALRRSHSLS